jgi:outer membrane protein insertion porin family
MALLVRLNSRYFLLLLCVISGLLVPPAVAGQDRRGPVVTIEGTDRLTRETLRSLVSREIRDIEAGRAVAADVVDIAYTMEQHLRDEGFASAVVNYGMFRIGPEGAREQVRTAREWDTVQRIEYVVETGKKTYFGTFRFEGVTHFSIPEIREQIPLASGVNTVAPIPFEEPRVRNAVRRLEDMYRLAGFMDARVGPATRQSREETDAVFVDIVIPVEEGNRYTISDVSVTAPEAPEHLQAGLSKGLSILGEPYFPRQVVVGEVEIRRILGVEGYRPEIQSDTRYSDSGEARIHYRVRTGPSRILGDLFLEAEDDLRTRESFIEQLLPLRRGEPIDTTALEEFEDRLYGLGVFSFIDIQEEPRDSGDDRNGVTTDLRVTVRESRSRYLEIGLGWGSYELLRGRINYTDNNVFGRSLGWSTTAGASFRTREFSTSLTDQTLLGPEFRLTVDGGYSYRDGPSYDRTRVEAGLTGVYRLTRRLRSDLSYRYFYMVVEGLIVEITGEEAGVLATGRIGSGITYDSRDSVLLPTRGRRLGLHGQWSSRLVGSEIDFAGLDVEGTTHHRLSDGTILSVRGEYRTRFLLEERESLPIQERLFLGGDRSVRSFTQDTLGPRTANDNPLGGLSTVLGSVELRQRIVGDLYVAGFYDIGSVSPMSWNYQERYTGMALGAGLRYHLPIGPLRLDGAWNPGEPQGNDSPWAIHFAVGFSF